MTVWNDVALQFIEMVKQIVVPHIPDAQREWVLENFADAVNHSRPAIIEGEVTNADS